VRAGRPFQDFPAISGNFSICKPANPYLPMMPAPVASRELSSSYSGFFTRLILAVSEMVISAGRMDMGIHQGQSSSQNLNGHRRGDIVT
jgi:hypothetical protein